MAKLPPEALRLRALSHPIRIALVQHLASSGPATATECAQFVAASPSALSWHLRALAKAGWVESVPSGHGRERPWRYVAEASNILPSDPGNPITESLETSLLARSRRLEDDFMRRRGALPEPLANLAEFNFSVLWMSPSELKDLAASINGLLQPYLRQDQQRPDDAVRFISTWTAVPWLAQEEAATTDSREGRLDEDQGV